MAINKEEIQKSINDSYELPNNVVNVIPEPLVSVYIATYQHALFINECIDSILMQKTNFSWELIIGEDFSTDGTREVVFDYAKKHPTVIRVLTANYNVKQKANRIRCLKACRGKYIAFCDGDDYWADPLKLQKQVDFMEENLGCYMTYHHYRRNIKSKFSALLPTYPKYFTADQLITTPSGMPINTKMIRNVFIGASEEIFDVFHNDYPMNALIGTYGYCKFLHNIDPSIYRHHESGAYTSKDARGKLYTGISVKIRIYEYFRNKNDDRRAMIALRALRWQLENNSKQIDEDTGIFTFNSSRFRIAYKGIKVEFVYAPIIKKLRGLIK